MTSHTRQERYLTILGVVIGFVGTALTVRAAWPSGGNPRTISGTLCTPFFSVIDSYASDCPFISDYVSAGDSFDAIYNGGAYADIHVASTNGGGWTAMSICRQPYTGGAASCSTAASEQDGTTGVEHLWGAGFATLSGATPWDYYYVEITTTEAVDQIYGVGYGS